MSYVNKVSFRKHLSLGLVSRETGHVIGALRLSVPSPNTGGGERGWRLNQLPTTNYYDYVMKFQVKTNEIKLVQRVSGLMNTEIRVSGMPSKIMETPCIFPTHFVLCISSIWLILSYGFL